MYMSYTMRKLRMERLFGEREGEKRDKKKRKREKEKGKKREQKREKKGFPITTLFQGPSCKLSPEVIYMASPH